MSAYALPSSFLSSLSSLSPISTSSSSSSSSLGSSETTTDGSNCSSSVDTCTTFENQQRVKPCKNSKVSPSSSTKDNDILTSSSSSSSTSSWYSSKNDLFISIKSASIDHIRLIQSFTLRKSSTANSDRRSVSITSNDKNANNDSEHSVAQCCDNNVNNEISSSSADTSHVHRNFDCSCDNDEQWGEYGDDGDEDINTTISVNSHSIQFGDEEMKQRRKPSTPPIPSQSKQQQPQQNLSSQNNDSLDNNNSVENDAIQFTLAISFNGRTYNATRTLPSFIKLRNDLMMELSNKCNNNYKRGVSKKSVHQYSKSSPSPSHLHRKDETENFTWSNDDIGGNVNVEDHHIIIPELPIGDSANNNNECSNSHQGAARAYSSSMMMGIAARNGFSGLQAAVLSYCPQMENWLRSVAALAPSSASLANFLWEPIHHQYQQENGQQKEQRQKQQHNHVISSNHHQISRSSQFYKHSKRKSSSASLMKLDSITEDSSDESDVDG